MADTADAAAPTTAHMHYDAATGQVAFDGTGQTTYILESAGGNLLAGALDPAIGSAIDNSGLPNVIAWLNLGGLLGLFGTGDAGNIVDIQTDPADLTFKYQNQGQAVQIGEITTINFVPAKQRTGRLNRRSRYS